MIRNADLDFFGCLGANAQYTGAYRLLSAAHVLTKFDRNYIGKQIQVLDGSQWVDIGATVTDQVDVVLYDSSTVPILYVRNRTLLGQISVLIEDHRQ